MPHPVLQTFDAPNGDFACVRRSRSDTPLQALTTLNEPSFIDCARALALRTPCATAARPTTIASRSPPPLHRARPTADELATLKALLAKEQQHFSAPGAKPWDLAAVDPKSPPTLPAGATPASLAAWTVVSRVILNLDETITKD